MSIQIRNELHDFMEEEKLDSLRAFLTNIVFVVWPIDLIDIVIDYTKHGERGNMFIQFTSGHYITLKIGSIVTTGWGVSEIAQVIDGIIDGVMDCALSIAVQATITSLAAVFSPREGVDSNFTPFTITAQLFGAPTQGKKFSAIGGTQVSLSPTSGGITHEEIITGLKINVTPGTSLILVWSATSKGVRPFNSVQQMPCQV